MKVFQRVGTPFFFFRTDLVSSQAEYALRDGVTYDRALQMRLVLVRIEKTVARALAATTKADIQDFAEGIQQEVAHELQTQTDETKRAIVKFKQYQEKVGA